jgi:Rieske 2Fe-2S family protein
LFARDTAKPFDMKALGLKSVACESVAGYIWICIAADPPDFAPFRTTMAPYFQPHNLTHAKVAFESTIVENGNWKLVWENNRECYHCLPNHPELCRSFPEDPSVTGVEGAGEDPEISAHWARLEARGLPSQFRMSPEGQFRVARMPLIKDVESYTMSGRRAVKQPLNVAFDTSRMGSLLMFHYPSMWNHVLGDHAITFRVLPLGPRQTAVTTKWLVNADAVEGVDYDLPTLTEVWMATNDQDRRIVEENQIGVSSPAFEPGPYNGLHEGGVMQFVDWYAGALERAQGGPGLRAHVA